MRTLGIIFIIAGLAMMIVRGISVRTEKKVLETGSLEIRKKENKWIGWPTYLGGFVVLCGILFVVSDKKKSL
jgi:hypothetical protein